MTFDWTINAGNVISLILLIAAGIGMWMRQDRLLVALITEVKALQQLDANMDGHGTSYSHQMAERLSRVEAQAGFKRREEE